MISKNSIQNLKNHIDIVDVISQFIELKRAGANYKACCPFHGEDTPSFVVSPAKQIYHCFGCGVGGDAIEFVKQYEKLDYVPTIEKLASMCNFDLEYTSSEKRQDTKVLENILKYYQKLFISNQEANNYMLNRGVFESSLEKFELGLAPSSQQSIDFLKSNFYNLSDAQNLGIIASGENGLYARFIHRIIFPIYNQNDKLVGFGGRTITDHNAKYINSPQTQLFNKSSLLYGYNLAKKEIFKKKEIIITEGYIDVIMLHQAGFTTSVATLGTALTKEHLPLLRRTGAKIIMAYDGDNAGLNAALKASILLSHGDFAGGVVIFKQGFDPADMVKAKKIKELQELFSKAKAFVPFVLDYKISLYNISLPEQKQLALNDVNTYLKGLSPLLQEEYSRYVARALSINIRLVQNQSVVSPENIKQKVRLDLAELQLIKTLLEEPTWLDIVLKHLNSNVFKTHKSEFDMLISKNQDEHLRGILLQENIKVLSKDELKMQIVKMLVPFYKEKISRLKNENLSIKETGFKAREYKEKIKDLMSLKFGF